MAREINIPSKSQHEVWFSISVNHIRFSFPEYALVTGLEFGPFTFDTNSEYDLSEVDLFDIFEEGHVNGADENDYLKVANILALYCFGLGFDVSRKVESFAWALVEDLDAWNNFSWGAYTYTSLLHYISILPKTKKGCGTKYHFYGPIWAYEAIPEFGTPVARRDKSDRLPRCLRWFFVRARATDFHVLLNQEIGCYETLTVEDVEQEHPYWCSIHCAEPMGASFHTPFNPVAPCHDPDQKRGKHKRPRQTRSGSSSSGDSDRRRSSLIASIKEALMPDIIRYLKNDLIADVKDSLLPDLKEFIQSLKCGSRRSTSHHSPHRISPIRPSSGRHDEGSHVSHHPEMARRSLHVDDDNTRTPHLVKDTPRRSLQIDTRMKPRERPRDRCSLQVKDFLRKDVTLSTREIGVDEEVDQVELHAEPNAPDFTEKRPQRMKKTSAHLSSPFLSQAPPTLSLRLKTTYIEFRKHGPSVGVNFQTGMLLEISFFQRIEDYNTDMRQEEIEIYTAVLNRRLLNGQHILPMVTADNTRLVSPNFFIVLAKEFNNIFNPSTLKYNVGDWEPPSGLKWEITRAGDDESRAWWNATHKDPNDATDSLVGSAPYYLRIWQRNIFGMQRRKGFARNLKLDFADPSEQFHQMDSNSCGPFACMYMERLLSGMPAISWGNKEGGVVRYRKYMARMIYDMCHPKVIPLFQP
ncbi:hypothetical protein C2S52_006117 [Perilla frutescens var. hirtella]|nr:hypothetical protein C2S52_006117 [Perilla frutescens var. hirtella]